MYLHRFPQLQLVPCNNLWQDTVITNMCTHLVVLTLCEDHEPRQGHTLTMQRSSSNPYSGRCRHKTRKSLTTDSKRLSHAKGIVGNQHICSNKLALRRNHSSLGSTLSLQGFENKCMAKRKTDHVLRGGGARDGNVLDVPILGLNLLSDVIHNVTVLFFIQQLVTSYLQETHPQDLAAVPNDKAPLWTALVQQTVFATVHACDRTKHA